jgi:hypothetical protein
MRTARPTQKHTKVRLLCGKTLCVPKLRLICGTSMIASWGYATTMEFLEVLPVGNSESFLLQWKCFEKTIVGQIEA